MSWGETDSLRAWAEQQLGIAPVIWLHPNAPRPSRPYASIRVLVDDAGQWAHVGEVDAQGQAPVTTHHAITTTLAVYSAANADPRDAHQRLTALRDALHRPSVRLELAGVGWAFVRVLLGPQDLPETIGPQWEPRATLDLEWRVARQALDDLGLVEQINLAGQASGQTVIDQEISV